MIRTFLAFFVVSVLIGGVSAQSDEVLPCRHNELELMLPHHQADLAQIALIDADLEQFTRDFEQSPANRDVDYIVPVVFHIIHNNGIENITNEQVEDAMRVLNEDFRKLNPDWMNVHANYLDIVADAGIEFRLAHRDPQGNCTTGITRTVSALTYEGDQDMKSLIQWPRSKYLNVWVAASAAGAAGYTYRPASVATFPAGDGIVMMHTYVGTIGTGAPSRSRTLTHEVGHWINLAHTWGNSNTPGLASNCNEDDNVSDTPNTIGWTICDMEGISCGSHDNVENYMEYAYCSKMFTEGQATRMVAALNSTVAQRDQLWQTSNLIATGAQGESVLCQAVFTGNGGVICAGGSVSYQDQSFHNVVSREWSFPGGTPSTSTEEDPVVTYMESGVFPVTLTVSDGSNSLTSTTENYVTVLPVPGIEAPFHEGFEEVTQLNGMEWSVNDMNGGNTFTLTSSAAYSGERSVRLINLPSHDGQEDELISTTFDLSEAEFVSISFRYAFARRTSNNDDRLRIYTSHNCGEQWSLRKQLRGSTDLSTAPNASGTFQPNGPEQWGYAVVDNIAPLFHVENFRFKFHFESDGGNTLYIDDININGMPVSVGELSANEIAPMMVMPNPASQNAQVIFRMDEADNARLELLDVLGRELVVLQEGRLTAGEYRVEVPVASLNSGMYFVRMTRNGASEVVRFVVE